VFTPTATPPGGSRAAVPAPTATPTATPTLTAICSPRPALGVTTTPSGAGRLQVTVTAPAAVHDWLQALRFGDATNAQIEAGAQSGTGSFAVMLAPGTRQTTFMVSRTTASQAVSVPFTAIDSCGDWPTFVGGGPGAF
jgi:hypothetical protein